MLISNAFMERDVPVLGIITALGLRIGINSFESRPIYPMWNIVRGSWQAYIVTQQERHH